jgi:hypothetical protein
MANGLRVTPHFHSHNSVRNENAVGAAQAAAVCCRGFICRDTIVWAGLELYPSYHGTVNHNAQL